MSKFPCPPGQLVGDALTDRICREMLEASRAYGAGEIGEEEYRWRRAYWGGSFLVCQGLPRSYRHPGEGGAGR